MLGTYYVPDSWAREIRSIGPPMAPPVFFSRVKPWFGAGRRGSSQKPVWRVVSFGRAGLQPNPLFGRRRMGRAGLRRRCEAAFGRQRPLDIGTHSAGDGVYSLAGYLCRGFFYSFCFRHTFNGVAPMLIDGDWEDSDSVEDWLAVVQFEGVPKDKTARWRRSLGTVLKYARRIPSGVLCCVYVTV